MAQFLIDDFADGVIDTTKWDSFGVSSGIAETGGRLTTSAFSSGVLTAIYGTRLYDIRKGILAIRLTKVSGSPNGALHTYFGIWNGGTDVYTIYGNTNTAAMTVALSNLGTGVATNPDTTVGLGPTLPANTWLGWSQATNVLTLSKSSDGVSWTAIHRQTVSAPSSFNYGRVGIVCGMWNNHTGGTNLVDGWDDLSYFSTTSAMRIRTRYSGAWVYSTPKVRQAGAWVRVVPKVRSGGVWVQPQ